MHEMVGRVSALGKPLESPRSSRSASGIKPSHLGLKGIHGFEMIVVKRFTGIASRWIRGFFHLLCLVLALDMQLGPRFNAGTTYIEGPQMRRRRPYIFYPDFKYA